MEILYHYCSTASFPAIVQSHAVWLSSLSLSNDTMEGKLVASAIARLADKDSLNQDSIRQLQEAIGGIEKIIDGLGFCLSEDGDLLSQWRGYAADATGVAIGFSTEHLNRLSEASLGLTEPGFTLQKVEYELAAHETRVEPTYREIKRLINAGAFRSPLLLELLIRHSPEEAEKEDAAIKKARAELPLILLSLFPELFRLKASAFREEREWRLLSHLIKSGEDHCSYRAAHDRIIPYRQVKLSELEGNPIIEVILGPKHATPPNLVEGFLKQNKYGAVRARRSEASYR